MENLGTYSTVFEGLTGGASSIVPVALSSFALLKVSEVVNKGNERDLGMIGYSVISLILGLGAGISGGVLADNYGDSAYNGASYGLVTSTLVSLCGLLYIRQTKI